MKYLIFILNKFIKLIALFFIMFFGVLLLFGSIFGIQSMTFHRWFNDPSDLQIVLCGLCLVITLFCPLLIKDE